MIDAVIIGTMVVFVFGFCVVLWSLRGSLRSTASLQIEQCMLNAEATVEKRRLGRMHDTIAKYSALRALGAELKPHEYEELRIAYNALYTTGLPSDSGGPDLDITAPELG